MACVKKRGDGYRVDWRNKKGNRYRKTFTLKKREYHLGLAVKVERLPDAKVTTPFRYQLMGGHGLPIEGVWYN